MWAFIHHIKEHSKEYLTFNYAERRGIMVLVILILLVEGVNAFLPTMIEEKSFDTSGFEEDIRQFELALDNRDKHC